MEAVSAGQVVQGWRHALTPEEDPRETRAVKRCWVHNSTMLLLLRTCNSRELRYKLVEEEEENIRDWRTCSSHQHRLHSLQKTHFIQKKISRELRLSRLLLR
jgi:hypothetical protein